MLSYISTVQTLITEPNYPQNFLIVNESGVHLVGADADLNHGLPVTSNTILATDTVSRVVYWYHQPAHSIARRSLNSGTMDVDVSYKYRMY